MKDKPADVGVTLASRDNFIRFTPMLRGDTAGDFEPARSANRFANWWGCHFEWRYQSDRPRSTASNDLLRNQGATLGCCTKGSDTVFPFTSRLILLRMISTAVSSPTVELMVTTSSRKRAGLSAKFVAKTVTSSSNDEVVCMQTHVVSPKFIFTRLFRISRLGENCSQLIEK